MSKKAILFLAEGFEEIEALTPVDYLRRAGIEVCTAAIGAASVTGSHGIPVIADAELAELKAGGKLVPGAWDAVLLPGGLPGASNLAASVELGAFLKAMAGEGKIVSAICASPAVVLAPLGLLAGRRFTCYPGMEEKVKGSASINAEWLEEKVVIDGNIVTSRAAGTAGLWAMTLIGILAGEETAKKLTTSVLLETDSFWSERNQARLRESLQQAEAGLLTEHELIEVD
ncbi:DJ-1 family protein [Spirochaetia bacterium]|nr:DJ-1 family protein [Spirochaetia bacterium]